MLCLGCTRSRWCVGCAGTSAAPASFLTSAIHVAGAVPDATRHARGLNTGLHHAFRSKVNQLSQHELYMLRTQPQGVPVEMRCLGLYNTPLSD